jgi:hypothetical protein
VKARVALVAASCLALSACSAFHDFHMAKLWPFHRKPQPAPEVVHELDLVNADGSAANYPQLWKRNTLVIDLTGISGVGQVAARLPDQTTWPVRVAVRVRPGSVQEIEVRGEERNVLPVSSDGTQPIDLTLASSVYRPTTAAIYISWGAMPVFVEGPAEPEKPGFVSPTVIPQGPQAPPTPAVPLPPPPPAPATPAPAEPNSSQPSAPPGN